MNLSSNWAVLLIWSIFAPTCWQRFAGRRLAEYRATRGKPRKRVREQTAAVRPDSDSTVLLKSVGEVLLSMVTRGARLMVFVVRVAVSWRASFWSVKCTCEVQCTAYHKLSCQPRHLAHHHTLSYNQERHTLDEWSARLRIGAVREKVSFNMTKRDYKRKLLGSEADSPVFVLLSPSIHVESHARTTHEGSGERYCYGTCKAAMNLHSQF